MQKDLNISLLLDFYGQLLTEKQKQVMEFYYNDDLSLSEIAENEGITRQGVHDAIKRGESILKETEEKLKLAEKFQILSKNINEISNCARNILEENTAFCYSVTVNNNSRKI
ncbi:MAG: putative DNA-binding protein, partial [Oscillospiraceae bacterium]